LNPTILFLDQDPDINISDDKQSAVYFLMDPTTVDNDQPLFVGFKAGQCGTLEESTNGSPTFQPLSYLEDHLSCQFALHLLQELDNFRKGQTEYLDYMVITLANYLMVKFRHHQQDHYHQKVGISGFKMKKIDAFIQGNIDQTISSKQLSELVGLSQFHFIRMFKKTTQQTPHQYINRQKMEKARDLLLRTDFSIIQIGFETGFQNPSHFTQVFKNCFGIPPLKYRKGTRSSSANLLVGRLSA
ncbi:MAG: AraC family transcriptional regulator, partial [Bacteroidota bacterium]